VPAVHPTKPNAYHPAIRGGPRAEIHTLA
jgi:hypothetical protein